MLKKYSTMEQGLDDRTLYVFKIKILITKIKSILV